MKFIFVSLVIILMFATDIYDLLLDLNRPPLYFILWENKGICQKEFSQTMYLFELVLLQSSTKQFLTADIASAALVTDFCL